MTKEEELSQLRFDVSRQANDIRCLISGVTRLTETHILLALELLDAMKRDIEAMKVLVPEE